MLRFRQSLAMILAGSMLAMAHAGTVPAERTMTLTLTSTAFASGGAIPPLYTCEGQDLSPPLVWQGVPKSAKSLVLIVDDPVAPDPAAPKTTWVHWLLSDLPPTAKGLPQAVATAALPAGTRQGRNDWKRAGYGGPCPPIGRHRYFHKLYALDVLLGDLSSPDKRALEAAMRGHVIASAELVGTYQKREGR
jgi:Raf kinase inhibitor-like YbhB/YbcL family protein